MKLFKKILCTLLICILILSSAPVALAEEQYPVVFVAGFTSSRMYLDRGTPEEKLVWKIHVSDSILDAVKKELPGIAATAGLTTIGCYTPLFRILEPYANEVIEGLRLNDDGSSKYPVEVYPHSVEDTRLDALDAIGYHPDHDTLVRLGRQVGKTNVYSCTLDWRMGQVDNAAVLNDYINEVLAVTGASKVNILGTSFGGQVVASYLALYGGEKVHNAVLHCPALDGSSIVPQLLSGQKIRVGWADGLRLYGAYAKDETDFASILEVVSPDVLHDFLRAFVQYFMKDFFLNFGSVWDLVPLDRYETLRDKLLRDGKHDAIIEKSDKYHYEVAAKRAETFEKLRKEGVRISIVAGYGFELVVANGTNSDGVIDLASTTGALVASPGKTLPKNYTQKNCVDTGHNHISASCTVDASVGYLPENTWFVEDMLHGLAVNEDKTNTLLMKLLCTRELDDVYSSPEYPQFMTSQNRCRGVYAQFDGCAEGFMTKYSTTLTIRNVSKKDSIIVDGITCKGAKLDFGFEVGKKLAPGETMTAKVVGTLPEKDMESITLTVSFVTEKEKYSVGKSRTQYFRCATSEESLSLVLTEHGENTIQNEKAVRSGRLTFKILIARVFYYIQKALAAVHKVF